MSASSLIVEKIQSMIVRNSFGDENSAATCQELPEEPEPEPEPDVRERFDVEREEARFEDDDLDAVDRDLVAAGFDAVDRDLVAAGFDAVDRDFVDRDFVEVDRDFVAVDRAFVGADVDAVDGEAVPGRSRLATRRASVSTSRRSFPSSSRTPCCSSDSRTFVTARATSSTIWLPRSFEPSGNARSTALRTASTVSAVPEPFLSFFFFPSFLAMARV
jgi:hypothetical protein